MLFPQWSLLFSDSLVGFLCPLLIFISSVAPSVRYWCLFPHWLVLSVTKVYFPWFLSVPDVYFLSGFCPLRGLFFSGFWLTSVYFFSGGFLPLQVFDILSSSCSLLMFISSVVDSVRYLCLYCRWWILSVINVYFLLQLILSSSCISSVTPFYPSFNLMSSESFPFIRYRLHPYYFRLSPQSHLFP